MKKVSSTSNSLGAQRIHSSFVERNRIVVGKASSVDAVTPVAPVKNEVAYSSANHLMASDQFYEKLEKLKKEYINFYRNERNLKNAVDAMENDNDINFENINNLINKYNKTVLALENLDKRMGGENISKIKDILIEYSLHLDKIGIYRIREKELEIDKIKFKDSIKDSKDDLDRLLNPLREFIVKLYLSFIDIKEENPSELEYSYEDDFIRKSGLILDSKT